MGEETGRLSRRQFVGAAAGAAAVAAASTLPGRAFGAGTGGIVPQKRLGIQLFTIRDAVPRLNGATMGQLSDDPTAPLVPLPGGFRAVFETLASYGYKEIEFAGYTQGANGPITFEEIRALLDEYQLKAVGTHLGLGNLLNPTTRAVEFERAQILGLTWVGTANYPLTNFPPGTTGQNTDTPANWLLAAERFTEIGEAAKAVGLKLYQHTHQNEYAFFSPTVLTEETAHLQGVRRYQYFLDNVRSFKSQMDVYWANVAKLQFTSWTGLDGTVHTGHLRPAGAVPGPAGEVRPLPHQGRASPSGSGLTFVDVGDGIIDYRTWISTTEHRSKHNYIVERDNAPGGSADPGRSLQFREAERRVPALAHLVHPLPGAPRRAAPPHLLRALREWQMSKRPRLGARPVRGRRETARKPVLRAGRRRE